MQKYSMHLREESLFLLCSATPIADSQMRWSGCSGTFSGYLGMLLAMDLERKSAKQPSAAGYILVCALVV